MSNLRITLALTCFLIWSGAAGGKLAQVSSGQPETQSLLTAVIISVESVIAVMLIGNRIRLAATVAIVLLAAFSIYTFITPPPSTGCNCFGVIRLERLFDGLDPIARNAGFVSVHVLLLAVDKALAASGTLRAASSPQRPST